MGSLGLVVVIAIVVAVYFYLQYQKNQPQANEQAVQSLVAEVSKLIELPTGEQPTVATVSDINKLKNQTFFAHAKNGDKVLIYTKAQKAILYDPTERKIVEVGPINLTQTSPTPAMSPTSAPVMVALYNGTTTTGLTSIVEKKLKTLEPNVTVVVRDNASKATYVKTTVIDLSGKHAPEAAALAKDLDGTVGSLPKGEEKPAKGDILVILGK